MSSRQFLAHDIRRRLERALDLFELELRLGTARRHIDVNADLCTALVERLESLLAPTVETHAFRDRIDTLLARLRERPSLRLVK